MDAEHSKLVHAKVLRRSCSDVWETPLLSRTCRISFGGQRLEPLAHIDVPEGWSAAVRETKSFNKTGRLCLAASAGRLELEPIPGGLALSGFARRFASGALETADKEPAAPAAPSRPVPLQPPPPSSPPDVAPWLNRCKTSRKMDTGLRLFDEECSPRLAPCDRNRRERPLSQSLEVQSSDWIL
eukprot:TRINITY_DN8436_c0_g1_i2.p1 TRINITY_DN8436_c0_g1~~TRINITY_DN8436_c0_g1_i2.p1  ORF type:complete len:196 (+),score=39.94 TRINITY_DN8436_c0_g1_i2:38-589(+)